MTLPLTRPAALPRGTVPGLSRGSPAGSIGNLFPVVTPAPAVPRAGRAQLGPVGASRGIAGTLTTDTGVIGGRQNSLIVLAVTIAAGIAVAGAWLTIAGPARRAVNSLARRRGRHTG